MSFLNSFLRMIAYYFQGSENEKQLMRQKYINTYFSLSRNKIGIEMCSHDENCCLVLAKILWFSPSFLVEVGEAMSIYHVALWGCDLQSDNMDFVLNSKKVVDYFQ